MISVNWEGMSGQIGALMSAYADLPRHIAKKHLQASMKRALKGGVPVLKRNTPKMKTRLILGKDKSSGEYTGKKVKGGSLRRAATTKAKYIGRNADGIVVGTLGYKYGKESMKAIFLEDGTSVGVKPREMVKKTMAEYGPTAASKLAGEMAKALEAAARDKAPGVDQGYRRVRK